MDRETHAMVAEIPALRRYGRTLTGNGTQADDLVQDTLERAIKKLHLFEKGTKLRLWLFTIMRNIFLDHYRKSKKLSLATTELREQRWEQRLPEQFDRLVHKDLVRELEVLKPAYRELLMLVGVEGVSYEEAAAITGVPLGTVRSRLFRARGMLMKRLEGEAKPRRRSARQDAPAGEIEAAGSGSGRRALDS